MFYPLESFIALRYVRTRRHRGIASFITLASVFGMALGVAALIVVLSVMNGLESELRNRLLSMTAHATLANPREGIPNWQSLRDQIVDYEGVTDVSPYVNVEGMLVSGLNLNPALIRGILPDETAISGIGDFMRAGSLTDLETGSKRIILGRILALNLGVGVGNRVNLLVPQIDNGRPAAELHSFVVSGIFAAGVQDHDAALALIHINDASSLRGFAEGRVGGVAVRLEDPMAVGSFASALSQLGNGAATYSDWTMENRSHFRAIRIEKTMMAILLMLIVAVAAFNVVASLIMVVTDKKKDIAILRTCGLEPSRVARIFIIQGSLIGCAGTFLGLIFGLLIAFNVETVFPWLERTFNFELMPSDVFYVSQLPSDVQWTDVTLISLSALLIAVLATIYPSRRAAIVAPAEALRYE